MPNDGENQLSLEERIERLQADFLIYKKTFDGIINEYSSYEQLLKDSKELLEKIMMAFGSTEQITDSIKKEIKEPYMKMIKQFIAICALNLITLLIVCWCAFNVTRLNQQLNFVEFEYAEEEI